MTHHPLSLMLLQLAVMLAVGLFVGAIAQRLRQPRVIGELLGGILLGPTVFGALASGYHNFLFPVNPTISLGRDAIIKIGLLFFIYIAGKQVDFGELPRLGKRVLLISSAGVLLPFVLGVASVFLLPGLWSAHTHGNGMLLALFIGTALSISALPVIGRILMDLGLLQSDLGRIVMASATIDDLLGWALFAVILSRFESVGSHNVTAIVPFMMVFGACVVIIVGVHWIGRRWMQGWGASVGFLSILILASAALTEYSGSDAVLGAFLVGVALPKGAEKFIAFDQAIERFVMGFLAPLYFVSIGIGVNFTTHFEFVLVGVIFAIACIGKIVGASFGAWLGRVPYREALAIGFGMNARGAMGIILASVALAHHLIDDTIFVALVTMALVTSIISGPMMQFLMKPRVSTVELQTPAEHLKG